MDGDLGEVGVTLNEEKREVTYIFYTGSSWTNPATFTKDKIIFAGKFRTWTIDRTNGKITSENNIYGQISYDYGKCKKAKKTKTLF